MFGFYVGLGGHKQPKALGSKGHKVSRYES